jgi:hypothetical protein
MLDGIECSTQELDQRPCNIKKCELKMFKILFRINVWYYKNSTIWVVHKILIQTGERGEVVKWQKIP